MAKLDKTDSNAPLAATDTAPTGTAAGTVRVKLGPSAPAGRLLVGDVVLSASEAGLISLEQFEMLKTEYDLIEE